MPTSLMKSYLSYNSNNPVVTLNSKSFYPLVRCTFTAKLVYASDTPLGPFTLAEHNPLVYNPEEFTTGAGNGGAFQDKYGNYWHVGTVAVTARHYFERLFSTCQCDLTDSSMSLGS